MRKKASAEQTRKLVNLIRANRVLDVQAWLVSGEVWRPNSRSRLDPVVEAVRSGSCDMVMVFLERKLDKEELTRMLFKATVLKRYDMVRLLLECGAEPRASTEKLALGQKMEHFV